CYLRENCTRSEQIFRLSTSSESLCNSQLHTLVGDGSAFAFAPALRHGRRTDIGAAASTRNFGACAFVEDSCNACPALFAAACRWTWSDGEAGRCRVAPAAAGALEFRPYPCTPADLKGSMYSRTDTKPVRRRPSGGSA